MPKIIFLNLLLFFFVADFSFASKPYTPPKGSLERKAILDALREGLKQFSNQEPSGIGFEYERKDVGIKWFFEEDKKVIFIVNYLKVKDSWAWIESNRRSSDGLNQYEPIDALFRKEKGKWVRKHTKPCCAEWEEDPKWKDVKSIEGYYRKLMQMFPGATRDLFPK